MNQEKSHTVDYGSILEAWMKMAGEFWKTAATGDSSASGTYGFPEFSHVKDPNKFQESLQSTMKMWSSMSSMLGKPHTAEAIMKGAAAVPEIIVRALGSGWEGYFRLQQQIMQRVGRIGQETEAYKYENLDENIFRVWADIYEKELSPYLKVPQLGLTRFYQERLGQAADKYNTFQASFAEFLRLLYLPVEKSSKVMQQKFEEMAKEGNLPDSPQDYYRTWIKILEGHYMTLFKSSEYAQSLKEILSTYEDYLSAREQILQDFLQSVPVPTNKEMDELYREIYCLKKKVKKLEKNKRYEE
jgi:hypothetical protein